MLKKALILILLLLGMLLGLVALALLVVNPNDYKSDIEQQVSEATGRNFTIGGDIGWSLWPGIGFELNKVTLSNPDKFKPENLFVLQKTKLTVALLPLLQQELVVNQVQVEGVQLNLITDKQGINSLDGLGGSGEEETSEKDSSDDESSMPLSELYIGSVTFRDIQLLIDDRQAGSTQNIHLEQLTLSELAPGKKSQANLKVTAQLDDLSTKITTTADFTLASSLDSIALHQLVVELLATGPSLPTDGKLEASLTAQGDIALDPLKVELKQFDITANEQVRGEGKLLFEMRKLPTISYNLTFDSINLDQLLPVKEDAVEEPVSEDGPATEPDLRFLNSFEMDGLIKVAELIAANVKIQNIDLPVEVKQGVLTTQPSMELYEGGLKADVLVDGRKVVASYKATVDMNDVQIRPLLTDAAEVDMLAGVTALSMDIAGSGLLPETIKRQAKGKGNIAFTDGAIYGVNIPQMLRKAKATLTGGNSEEIAEERKTDFTSLTGSFTLDKGKVNNPDLAMLSPLLRIEGKGWFNLLDNAIDYQTLTEVVGSLEGQGGEDKELTGIKIPLRVSGTPDNLDYKFDMQKALKSKATKELKEKTNEEIDKVKNKLKGKLGGFFGGG